MMKMRGEDVFLDNLTDFIVTRVPLEVRRDEPHLCRDLATALLNDGWADRNRDMTRYVVRVVPLTQRCGGMYSVYDKLTDDTVAYFTTQGPAAEYAAGLERERF